MLDFPPIARDMDHANLIWKAIAYDPEELTKESFLKELNKQLSAELSQREEKFHILTSVSFESQVDIGTTTVENVRIQFCGYKYPRKFLAPRSAGIQDIKYQKLPVTESPQNYNKIIATVTAKKTCPGFYCRAARDRFASSTLVFILQCANGDDGA